LRFNKRITLVKEQGKYYDPNKGEMVENPPDKTTLPCNINNLGIDRKKELFGEIDANIVVARLIRPYNDHIDYALIGKDKYQIKSQSNYRKGVLFMEGDSVEN